MAIFRRYVEDLLDLVPTLLRRKSDNLIRLTHWAALQVHDGVAQALEEYILAWPIDTAPTWVLDDHWLPYHGLQRNGQDDATVRRYIHAKRRLNKSWGAPDQILGILGVLLPGDLTEFTYFPPKNWVVNVVAADEAKANAALRFLTKKPSPGGGGFSVAGDNGLVLATFKEGVLAYSSVHGAVPVSPTPMGWYTSVHGVPPSLTAGHVHAAVV